MTFVNMLPNRLLDFFFFFFFFFFSVCKPSLFKSIIHLIRTFGPFDPSDSSDLYV